MAGDLAAKVVASLVSIPPLSDNEVVQVVREYLAGLIEDSPLKDTFAAWIERLPGAKPPPGAAAEVVPVPERLEQAATAELSAAFTAAGDDDPVTDPLATDPALTRAQAEDPLAGAVDLINQARYAQDQSGPCAELQRARQQRRQPAGRGATGRPRRGAVTTVAAATAKTDLCRPAPRSPGGRPHQIVWLSRRRMPW